MLNKKKKMKIKKNKKAIALNFLGWLILSIAIFVLVVIAIVILTGKADSAIEFIKNLFRFGGV